MCTSVNPVSTPSCGPEAIAERSTAASRQSAALPSVLRQRHYLGRVLGWDHRPRRAIYWDIQQGQGARPTPDGRGHPVAFRRWLFGGAWQMVPSGPGILTL
jgi:hypothetical protein